ncbi:3'-5' exonuclease [Azospirillum ramasamyi]|nr:exonuclease domain-containing protein [Azospirillum ramasamyi]
MTGSAATPAPQPQPRPRRMIPLAFRAAGLGLVALSVGLAMAVRGSDAADPLLTYAVVMTAACAAAVWGLWLAVDRYLLRAAETLSREAGLIAHGNAEGAVGGRVPLARYGDLQPIARAVNDLSDKLALVRRDIARTVAESTAKAEEQKTQLAAVLRDLHEGVLVCNTRHQILLYNQTALDILHLTGELGLGRSLLHFVVAEPLTHTLERLSLRVREGRHINHEHGTTAQFVGATTDGRILLEGRMSAILQDPEPGSDETPGINGPIITGYVLTLSDATSELAALGQRDALLREATEGFRAPIANLRAAVETLYDAPDLGPGDRAAFESAMLDSCDSLSRRLEQVTAAYRSIVTGSWPMSDIHSNNLIGLVAHRVGTESPTTVTLTGLPQWVHGDSHGLVLLFAYLIEKVHHLTGATAFDLEAAGPQDGDRWVYLDLVWEGPAVPSATLDGWLEQTLPGGLGGLSAGDVLQHHRSTAWSEPLATSNGTAMRARLRVPLPPAQSPRSALPRPRAGARPEFFDFGLLHQPLATSELGRTPLDRLHYVVFDTETTGLSPSTGDEIIQIAAVRVVGGRILTGETFNTLVDPKRPIPPESVPFHGITDGMVAGQPTIDAVLPQFRGFVSGAVLVAHNAAFDLKFLKMKERAAGVCFDCPVLDTMLLSRMLLGNDGDHTLDGIAERLGIEVVDRHTALGDSLVTAAVFLRMIEMLRERDVRTLDDAIRGANILVELAARERAF